MKKTTKLKIVIFRESLIQSLLSDFSTFAIIVGSYAINYYLIDGNNWLDGLLTVLLILWLMVKNKSYGYTFYKIDDVVDFLKKRED